jgi:hypothetical protein
LKKGVKATPAKDQLEAIAAGPADLTVRFLVRDAPWNAGEVCSFPAVVAKKLIRAGVAARAERRARANRG